MLVLTRKVNERIVIDGDVVIEVLEVLGNRVRLGITAPSGVTILREELLSREKQAPGASDSKAGTLVGAS